MGICNGCQLMAELGLVYPEHEKKHKMVHNDSHKFESNFVSLEIPKNNSVMFGSLSGTKLGVWVAHGEGKFEFPYEEKEYNIIAKYNYILSRQSERFSLVRCRCLLKGRPPFSHDASPRTCDLPLAVRLLPRRPQGERRGHSMDRAFVNACK